MKKTILITGASGFIGSALCRALSSGFRVVGADNRKSNSVSSDVSFETADLTDSASIHAICKRYAPDIVIHCAGIAHQKIGAVDAGAYMRVNSEATEELAKAAAGCNPEVWFIFLSSVSVYGEGPQITQNEKDVSCKSDPQITQITQIERRKTKNEGIDEESVRNPSSDYAVSKLDAERRLVSLFDDGKLNNLTILRLAPVYDREWSLNLDRRVFAPGKMAYLRFGTGMQRMSALARPNLVEFIEFLILRLHGFPQIKKDVSRKGAPVKQGTKGFTGQAKALRREEYPQVSVDENNLSNRRNLRMNVCDAEAYDFNMIIEVFRKSGIHPNRPVISFPLSPVWFATRVAGVLFPDKKDWFLSCYDKLASDLVFDNGRMMGMGFKPRHSLETIFDPQITQICAD